MFLVSLEELQHFSDEQAREVVAGVVRSEAEKLDAVLGSRPKSEGRRHSRTIQLYRAGREQQLFTQPYQIAYNHNQLQRSRR
jgi:hypothetical protein